MTVTAPETRAVNPFDPPLDHAQRRRSLIDAARIRYRHPTWARSHVTLDAPAVPAGERGAWLDEFGALVDNWRLLASVGNSDDARNALIELHEGPWDEPLPEAWARRDELSAEIDRMVREAAGESTVDGAA